MKVAWSKGLDKDAIKELRGDFISSQKVRKRLTTLCEKKISTADTKARDKDGYDCPNWAYKQADIQGYKRALHEVISLLEK